MMEIESEHLKPSRRTRPRKRREKGIGQHGTSSPRIFRGSRYFPTRRHSITLPPLPPPHGNLSSRDTRDVTFCNDKNRQANMALQQKEPSTNVCEPAGDLLKLEEQYTRDMKILYEYAESDNMLMCHNGHDIFLDALRRLSNDYIKGLLKERERLKYIMGLKNLNENYDFIMERLNSMLNLFRLANGAIGISKKQQDALLSSEKVLDGIQRQLIDHNVEFTHIASTSPPRNVPSLVFNQELEKARNEAKMLVEQLAGTQKVLEKVKNDQMDKQKNLVAKLLEIRASLVEKSRCSELIKKSFTERINIEEILFDINKLIKDSIQFKDEQQCEKLPITAHSSKVLNVTEYEVHLVTMLASYLKVISFSVTLDFIYSYAEKVDNALSKKYVESLLKKYPTFFLEETIGAGSEKKWRYLELKPIITI